MTAQSNDIFIETDTETFSTSDMDNPETLHKVQNQLAKSFAESKFWIYTLRYQNKYQSYINMDLDMAIEEFVGWAGYDPTSVQLTFSKDGSFDPNALPSNKTFEGWE